MTTARARPSQLKPSWVVEEEEAREQFHAHPLKCVTMYRRCRSVVMNRWPCRREAKMLL